MSPLGLELWTTKLHIFHARTAVQAGHATVRYAQATRGATARWPVENKSSFISPSSNLQKDDNHHLPYLRACAPWPPMDADNLEEYWTL